MSAPPELIVSTAVQYARMSPCAKSQRGVVIYELGNPGIIHGVGWNAPPAPMVCDGSAACRRDCPKICVHAEMKAILGAAKPSDHELATREREHVGERILLHVKVIDGALVPGGGPSCWQCSRLILEAGIAGVWLFEAQRWHDEVRCQACSRITRIEQDAGTTGVCEQCDHVGRLLDLPGTTVYDASSGAWRFYTAEEFHRATLAACGLHAGELEPAVHVLWGGKAICESPYLSRFPNVDPSWPDGQTWVSLADMKEPAARSVITCRGCQLRVSSLINGLNAIGVKT